MVNNIDMAGEREYWNKQLGKMPGPVAPLCAGTPAYHWSYMLVPLSEYSCKIEKHICNSGCWIMQRLGDIICNPFQQWLFAPAIFTGAANVLTLSDLAAISAFIKGLNDAE